MSNVLKLQREVGETVVIPEIDCTITVEDIDDDGVVTLSFNAPRSVEILRLEVWQRSQRNAGLRVTGERPTGVIRES